MFAGGGLQPAKGEADVLERRPYMMELGPAALRRATARLPMRLYLKPYLDSLPLSPPNLSLPFSLACSSLKWFCWPPPSYRYEIKGEGWVA